MIFNSTLSAIRLSFAIVLVFHLNNQIVWSQCSNLNIIPVNPISLNPTNADGSVQILVQNQLLGFRSIVTDELPGQSYEFTSSNAFDFITIRDQDFGILLGTGYGSVVATPISSKTSMHLNLDSECSIDNPFFRTTSVRCVDCLPPPPSCANLISPANNATVCPVIGFTMSWQAVPTAEAYDFYFGEAPNPPFATTFGKQVTSTDEFYLAPGTFYWKIVPKNSGGSAAGCSVRKFIVSDTEKPTITCPANIQVNNDPNECSAKVNYPAPVANDNCQIQLVELQIGALSGAEFPVGTTLIRWEATDINKNEKTCTFNITVKDNQKPNITCGFDVVKNADPGLCSASVFYVQPQASDNCSIETLAQTVGLPSGSQFPVGVTLNTWEAKDVNGLTKICNFKVTINDTQKPTISCPPDLVKNNDPGVCGAQVSYNAPQAQDNCGIESVTQTLGLPSGSVFPVGITLNTWKAKDVNGNTNACNFKITVQDNEKPLIVCPGDLERNIDPGKCSAVVNYAIAIGHDNCGLQEVVRTEGLPSGSVFPVGATKVVYKATDIHNNTATCSFFVNVRDNEKPSFVCPANLSKPNDFGDCGRHLPFIGSPNEIKDNCGIQSVTNDSPSDFPVGETYVTWKVLDIHDNSATCLQKVTIIDYEWPVINCPQTIQTSTTEGECEALSVDFEVTATDNCPGVTIQYDIQPKSNFHLGYTDIEVVATDLVGHETKCHFQILVEARKEICNGFDDDCDGFTDEVEDWKQIVKTKASNGLQGDEYGYSVAILGDWAIVGMNEKNQVNMNIASAYLLRRNAIDPSDWYEVEKLQAPGQQLGNAFGTSVALGQGVAIVGAPNAAGQGAVYVFHQNPDDADEWAFTKTITAADGAQGDAFGQSLALHGHTLLVGAPSDNEAAENAGAVYFFGKNTGGNENWGQIKKRSATNGNTNDNFGISVAIDGQNAIAGATGDDTKGLNAGAAYIFNQNIGGADNWGQVSKLMATTGATGDNFGMSVGISGSNAIVGASMDDDKALNAGTAFIFRKSGNGWLQSSKLYDFNGTDGDEYGHSVCIAGDYAVVGARKNDSKAIKAGAAFVYHQEGGDWELFDRLQDGQGRSDDQFGSAVAIYNSTIIIGAPMDDELSKNNLGSASIFEGLCSPSDEREVEKDFAAFENEPVSNFNAIAYPVPFVNALNIKLEVPPTDLLSIVIFNAVGQQIAVLHNGPAKGLLELIWNAEAAPSGVYFIRIECDGKVETKQVTRIRT